MENFYTVSRRIPHHSGHSGYDELARYVGKPVQVPQWLYQFRGLGPLHRYFRKRAGMEWYDGLYAELVTFFAMRRNAPGVYHFLFPERDFRYLPAFHRDRRDKIVCTFHATPDEFKQVMKRTDHLKSIDAAIIVSRNQASIIESILEREKVIFIPHGLDTQHFVPPPNQRESKKTCLCVGHHHRDFQTLARVASLVRTRDPEVRFVAVNRVFSVYFTQEQQRQIKQQFEEAGNVELRTGITDEELLRLYQTCDLMVLPLFDATANVAVLEALGCGLPLVVTNIGGIPDYLDQSCAAFAAPQDAQTMADHVIHLLQNHEERATMSKNSRTKALTFDWKIVAAKVKELYSEVSGQNEP